MTLILEQINLGTAPGGKDGDTQRTANGKTNSNMGKIVDAFTGLPTTFAPLDSPQLAGAPTAPTAPQFDSSLRLVNTAFLGARGIQASGLRIVTTGGTLALSVIGGTVVGNSSSATTQTLPAANTVPSGARIEFININTGVMTVARAGTDVVAVNVSTVTSLALGAGDTLTLESNGAGIWYAVAGSAQLGYSGLFGASLSGNGYQKLPSGLIIQWGGCPASSSTGDVTCFFPVAFPTAVYQVVANAVVGGAAFGAQWAASLGGFNWSAWNYNGTRAANIGGSYMAIGR